jgi:pimeloyl-ACP methyl ester carboxylesterase
MTWYHDFVTGFLEAVGAPRVSIVGHSMGALVGSSYALLHPDRVSGLTLVAAPAAWVDFELPLLFRPFTVPLVGEIVIGALPVMGPEHPLGIRLFYEGLMHAPGKHDQARMRGILAGCVDATRDPKHREAFLTTLRANLAIIRTTARAEFVDRLLARPLPVLIIAGREDRLFPLPLVTAGAAAHPSIRLEVLDACGHFPMWEQAEAVEALITGFAASHAARAA